MGNFLDSLRSFLIVYNDAGDPQLLETTINLVGLFFLIYFVLEAFYVIKSSTNSIK